MTPSPKLTHDEQQHKKMLLSSRANPPKPLQFGGGSRSKTDHYLSIKHLLPSTPVPSPSLPSILPRHGKKPPKLDSRKIVRFLLWLSFIIGVYYLVAFGKRKSHHIVGGADLPFFTSLGKTYEIVEASELPDHPTPLALTDHKGIHHWTISIPQNLGFPLPPSEYADICEQSEEVARHVAGSGSRKYKAEGEGYYDEDATFIDVGEAMTRGFLPAETHSDATSANKDNHLPVCEKSLTYVLDAADAGLGSALLGMWLSYSLARLENRAFFIDDAHFPYGNYSTFFTSPQTHFPSSPCRPPPPSHRVSCPHHAKHLVVTAATTSWIFGEAFHQHYSKREIFDMAREGYEALFHLRPEDETYTTNRALKLRKGLNSLPQNGEGSANVQENGLVGIHIRRGDRHPFSLPYSQNYIPPAHYLTLAHALVGKSPHWTFLVASDDADMYADHTDLPDTLRAQERISLASKKHLAKLNNGKADGGLGWEGGFFKDVFWNLGLDEDVKWETRKKGSPLPMKTKERFGDGERVHHHDSHKSHRRNAKGAKGKSAAEIVADADAVERDYRTHPTKEALQLRELLGRAYLLDLAMLAKSDKVVCGVSANACRILAVMLGWERSFEKHDWNNVDGGYEWRVLDY